MATLNSTGFAGYGDWRLPDRNELQSLVDYSRYSPAIDPLLAADTVSSYYWSSNTVAVSTYVAWLVDFYNGNISNRFKSYSYYARAVRAGQSRSLGSLIISVPAQSARWFTGEQQTITWDTAGIAGNVRITLSRQGGKAGTFTEVLAENIPNSGTYTWTVTTPTSVNCALRAEPVDDSSKGTTQSLFTISTIQSARLTVEKQGDPGHYQLTINVQDTDGLWPAAATFTTSDATVATVDQEGLLTALKNGYVEVSTTYIGKEYKKGVFVYTTLDSAELEANNTKGTANTLAANQFRRGKVNPSDDLDFFRITLAAPSLINIGFLSQSSTADVKVDLYSTADVLLASGVSVNGLPVTLPVGLPAGDYYLKLSSSGDIDETNFYIVSWKNLDSLPAKSSVPIAVGETKTGTINTLTDSADFTFTLATQQPLKIDFIPASDQAKYHITLLDSGLNVVDQIDALNQQTVSLEAVYATGSYTLRVTPVDSVDALSPFSVRLTTGTNQTEKEPNNTSAQATAWNTTQAISGRLMSNTDLDFYAFTLATARNVDITFTSSGSTKNFVMSLYKDSDQNQIDGMNVTGGKQTTLPVGLQPGTYYLKISGDGTNTDTLNAYTLTLADSSQTSLEIEPNNTILDATPLENNINRKGRIFAIADKDHYGFYLNAEGFFTVTFTPSTTTADYNVSILDVLGNVLDYFNSTNGETKTTDVYQAPGNFYLLIEANGDIDQINPYQIKVSSGSAITAPVTHTITASASAGGTISPSGALPVPSGANQTFIFTPAAGYMVNDILVDSASIGKPDQYTFTNVTASHTLEARFATSAYNLTVNKDGTGSGTITSNPAGINCGDTCSHTFEGASNVTLTATANPGSTFTGWTGSGCSGIGACSVTIDAAKSVTATFNITTYNLSVTKTGSGGGSVTSSPTGIDCGSSCSATYNTGTSVTLTATPVAGSLFTGWTGGGCSGAGTCVVAMNEAQSIAAAFNIVTVTRPTVTTGVAVNITSEGATLPGIINPNGGETTYYFQYGLSSNYDRQTPNAVLAAGATSQSVSANITGLSGNTTYYFRIVATNSAGNSLGSEYSFKTLPTPNTRKMNVIIVAGGSPTSQNNIWNATKKAANHAYNTLIHQGIDKSRIYYLSQEKYDADGDSQDDVNAYATAANLQTAINWAATDADDVLLYMVDHGSPEYFVIRQGETVTAQNLNSWLDGLQEHIQGKVIVIYDACYAGSFLPLLTPPVGKERIVLASTSAQAQAAFLTDGTLSFSNLFWSEIKQGNKFYNAYLSAKKSMNYIFTAQVSQLDANGDGVSDKNDTTMAQAIQIGNEIGTGALGPSIGEASPEQTISGSTATIYADNVTGDMAIQKVWAVITPPNYTGNGTVDALTDADLPTVNLTKTGDNRWEVTYNSFTQPGTYTVTIFAMDNTFLVSQPVMTTVKTDSTLLYGSFTGYGLYQYEGNGWSPINSVNPDNMTASGGTLYADFANYGLYKYVGGTWSQINTVRPTNMLSSDGKLYSTFAGYGFYQYDGTKWIPINSVNPDKITASSGILYADFANYGLYKYDGGTWFQINTVRPSNMLSSDGKLYATFNGYGFYHYDGNGWIPINSVNSDKMTTSGGILYADFANYGLYKYAGGTWSQINTVRPANMLSSDGKLYATFTGYGFYQYDNATGWKLINSVNPESMTISGGILYPVFKNYGFYKYDGKTWTQINTVIPAKVVAGE